MFLTHRPQNKTRNAYLVFVLPPKPLIGFISRSEIPARISCANSRGWRFAWVFTARNLASGPFLERNVNF